VRLLATVLVLATSLAAQTTTPGSQLILDNEFVRILRVTVPAGGNVGFEEKDDAVVVRLPDEAARFIPKGKRLDDINATSHDIIDLVVELKRHWEAEIRPCSYPMQCTRETRLGEQPIAWTTTLFTNGFITVSTHKVIPHGTLSSSYYTSKGSDRIVVIPFTNLDLNFGGIDESLKVGQPYFGPGTEVEVTAKDDESRWLVLRINSPGK
jgi:hypothetical protein